MTPFEPENLKVDDSHYALWVTAHKIIDMKRHTDMAQGHLSVRDPEG